MTQVTEQSHSLPQAPVAVQGGASVALVASFVRGATAAGLGLGVITVLVMVMWISSPFPDSDPADALHVAAALWLLAHGTELVRTDTLTGAPAPMGIVPLLLVAVAAWPAHRAARDALEPAEGRPRPSAWSAPTMVASGYVMVGAPVVLYVAGGSFAADPLSALVHLPLVTFLAAATGAWNASGRPLGPLPDRVPQWLRAAVAAGRVSAALRSAAAGTITLLVGGAVLAVTATVWHGRAAQESFLGLSGEWSGRAALGLLALALLPNAAVWGAAYGLGPGFAVGTGATAAPLAATGTPALPDFPLLAAVPGEGPGTPLHWAAVAIPVVAAGVLGWFTAGAAAPRHGERESAWSSGGTALTVLLGAAGCAGLMCLLAAASGGPLGTGRLSEFGPVWWLTGGAALLWTAGLGIPLALALRAWRLRTPGRGRGWGLLRRRGAATEGPAAAVPFTEAPPVPPAPPTGQAASDTSLDGGPGPLDDESELYDFLPADTWTARDPRDPRGPREDRWAALKESSGGLMPDFPPLPLPAPPTAPGPGARTTTDPEPAADPGAAATPPSPAPPVSQAAEDPGGEPPKDPSGEPPEPSEQAAR
ncbi:cell division protein PerM [Streptomyces pristinaespiralis]|uniref:cell division protein PerM n=1 Tax=Streptomyces pristinaespiralis TaxID=38300 RepID=UPI0038397174